MNGKFLFIVIKKEMLNVYPECVVIELKTTDGKIGLPLHKSFMKSDDWESLKKFIKNGKDFEYHLHGVEETITLEVQERYFYIISTYLTVKVKLRTVKEQLIQIIDDITNIPW